MTTIAPFKTLYFVLATPEINEAIAKAMKDGVGCTEINLVTRRPALYTHDIEVWIVNTTILDSLVVLQKSRNELLFTAFVQRREAGRLMTYKHILKKVPQKPKQSIANLVSGGILQTASKLQKVFYVTGKEFHSSILKKCAESHGLVATRKHIDGEKGLRPYFFSTMSLVNMNVFLHDPKLPTYVKEHIIRYISAPGKKPIPCNDDFSAPL